MGAPELLHHLRDAGLVLTLRADGGLQVAPRRAISDEHRAAIRADRDALVQTLRAETTALPLQTNSAGPAPNVDLRDDRPADRPKPSNIEIAGVRDARQGELVQAKGGAQVPKPRDGARSGMSDIQRHAADRYYAHHFKCRTCIAAGRDWIQGKRCAVGLALWTAYLACD